MAQAITVFDLDGKSRKLWVDEEGRLVTSSMITEMEGIVSEDNSTTDLLGADGVYTGEWELIKDYAIIKVGIYSDVAAASGGLCFQQSPDKSIIFDEVYELAAGDKKLFTPNPVLKWFRIKYTNGPVPQGEFGIQTIYSSVYTKPTSHRLGDNVTGNDDTELTKSVLAYRNEVDDNYKNVGVQSPLPVDGDSVYLKDIWVVQSDIGDFSGTITDLFDNLHSIITNTTSNNPKEIIIHFNRTIISNVVGLGAYSGNFSNVLIQIGNSGGVFTTVIDESTSDTNYTSRTFQLPITAGFNCIKLQFHTTDTVTISNCVILKSKGVVARLQAKKPDDTITDINATAGGNLKTSLEELESGISDDSNAALKVSPYAIDEYNTIARLLCDNMSKGVLIPIPPEHHEIHCGDSYEMSYITDLGNGGVLDILIVVPNEELSETNPGDSQSTKQYHLKGIVSTEAEATIEFFEDTEVSANGTAIDVYCRNRNYSSGDEIDIYHTPTVTTTGTRLVIAKSGSGRSVGGTLGRSDEFILKDNTNYLLRISNNVTTNEWVSVSLDYYVHPGV